ncbi:hypothetical protein GCM10018785_05620 [Streptomyces longispororuber]|uniref:Uncharacterized protein n=1 Tax=Streptomyces longispororuber TaxID=68230 RepID=A0A919DDL6_9ACTN|nr:hypothetical protein [Streptomyces longispororuber]GHE38944.1 hypothetical protein GCM10018785_05620 [Streptomyces longispororuber]
MAMPWVPYRIPVPGDRAFLRATRVIEGIRGPVVDRARPEEARGTDVVSAL